MSSTTSDNGLQLINGPDSAPATLLLAHGAGAPMDSPFMETIASGLGERGWRVLRFEFPYMARQRLSGRRSAPDRQPKLLDCFREQVALAAGRAPLLIGGKSMGGRMASLLVDELAPAGVCGCLCLGYPFHPPGKPEQLRTEHLAAHLHRHHLHGREPGEGVGDGREPVEYVLRPQQVRDAGPSVAPFVFARREVQQVCRQPGVVDALGRALVPETHRDVAVQHLPLGPTVAAAGAAHSRREVPQARLVVDDPVERAARDLRGRVVVPEDAGAHTRRNVPGAALCGA